MPRPNFYQAVIFKLEGLLLDTERITCDAWKRAGGGLGYPMSNPVARTLVGLTPSQCERFLRSVYGPWFPFAAVSTRMQEVTDAYVSSWGVPVRHGVRTLLHVLSRLDIRIGVYALSCKSQTLHLLDKASIGSYFDAVVSVDEIGQEGELLNVYQFIAERLHVETEKCLAVEDSSVGVRKAHTAGMTVICVSNNGLTSGEDLAYVYRHEPSLPRATENFVRLLTGKSIMDLTAISPGDLNPVYE